MEDFNSETDSDYTSYWRDWVGRSFLSQSAAQKLLDYSFLLFQSRRYVSFVIALETSISRYRIFLGLSPCYINQIS